MRCQPTQQSESDRSIVDEHSVAPRAVHLAPDYDFIVVAIDPSLGQDLDQGFDVAVEDPRHFHDIGAGANEIDLCPCSRQQGQRVDDDRLAGAGLAGEDVESGGEIDVGVFEDGEVLDVEVVEHGSGSWGRWIF